MSQTKDQLAIQYGLLRGLQSCALFNAANIVLGREYMSAKIGQDAVWQTPAPSGNVGVGMIVQIPQLLFPKPNSLQREREYSIGIYEEPDRNFTPPAAGFAGGTMTAADDWADDVIDFIWNWRLWRAGGLIPQERAVVPDTRFVDAGIIGVRCVCILRQERNQPARCAVPQIGSADIGGGQATVTLSVTDGSTIWYTTDGFSMPSPKTDGTLPGETAAVHYAGPFNVAVGTIIMCAAWPNNNGPVLPSQTNNQTIA